MATLAGIAADRLEALRAAFSGTVLESCRDRLGSG